MRVGANGHDRRCGGPAHLSRQWLLVGNGRGDITHENFRARVHEALTEFGPKPDGKDWESFAQRTARTASMRCYRGPTRQAYELDCASSPAGCQQRPSFRLQASLKIARLPADPGKICSTRATNTPACRAFEVRSMTASTAIRRSS